MMQQRQRPAHGAGPLTRPRRPRLAVVRWRLLDSCPLWCYTECSSLCFCILCFVALGPAADAAERRKNPSPVLSPGGGFSCVWGLRWAVGQGPTVGLAPIGSSGWRSYVKARRAAPQGLGLGIRSPVRYPAAAGVSSRPSRPQCGQRPRLRGPSGRRLNCGPPQGQGLQQQPAAGAPARLGGGTPSEGPRAATPARRAGPEGRTAPQPPLCGGRAAPEHLRRNRHGGGAMQGRANGPPRRGLALHCGGVPPCNGCGPT